MERCADSSTEFIWRLLLRADSVSIATTGLACEYRVTTRRYATERDELRKLRNVAKVLSQLDFCGSGLVLLGCLDVEGSNPFARFEA